VRAQTMRTTPIGTGLLSPTLLLPLFVLASCSQAPAHTDHLPRHGGIVLMNGDLHFEVILTKEGRHRVYFSDAVRAELPASIASELTLTITQDQKAAESVNARIEADGKSWVANGQPVDDVNAVARIAFTAQGRPYWIDLPFGF
jgi:hypothetical protein